MHVLIEFSILLESFPYQNLFKDFGKEKIVLKIILF